ncbi:hypothetical protein CY34DRAFT_724748 [Suillus luteus UH-Slu-Lm8-n1]|uniref:Uncharacterized protein n=1 Tax=Suillus luteus UH-Slu-Lm8-n1 TaxID=930992 RepID=A0A0D0AMZ4_9AGAM|nr:hypothetical protein CY34DRAFT_724748 [Suillus luteus UH-Slu-Lm8-n1]
MSGYSRLRYFILLSCVTSLHIVHNEALESRPSRFHFALYWVRTSNQNMLRRTDTCSY